MGQGISFWSGSPKLWWWGWNKQAINTLFSDSCSPQITLIGSPEYGRSDLREIKALTIMSKKVTSSFQDKQCINDFIISAIIRIELVIPVVPFLQFERSRKTSWVQQHKIYSHSKFFWKPYFKILNEKK